MPPGPPPKPTALKRLAGNPGKRKLDANEPQPERVIPAMPRGLPKRAQRFWKDYADKLDRLGLLTEVDGPAFMMMAIHYDVAWEAMQVLKEDGLVTMDTNGMARKHPMLQVLRQHSALFLRFAVQFGLTPSARSRLSIPEPPGEDDYEAFLRATVE
jgi:P27 family predicted phage terminase small subunit